ncbi:UNVERIFIED_CONTAM: hypothetical protein FKN15_053495 [Acipenser sinensis]
MLSTELLQGQKRHLLCSTQLRLIRMSEKELHPGAAVQRDGIFDIDHQAGVQAQDTLDLCQQAVGHRYGTFDLHSKATVQKDFASDLPHSTKGRNL